MKIKFMNNQELETGRFKKISDHVVEISGCEQNLSGFQLVNDNGTVYGSYEDYTTLYCAVDGGFQLSNDGSVYLGGDPEQYVPTLEELKSIKISEIDEKCKKTIHNGIDVKFTDGVTEHFSLKEEDQINLFGKQAQITAGITQLEYHQDSHPCRYYTVEEMTAIISEAMQFVSYHTTYCNSMHMWINAVTDKEDLEQITYGAAIPEEYQSEVLKTYLAQMGGEG